MYPLSREETQALPGEELTAPEWCHGRVNLEGTQRKRSRAYGNCFAIGNCMVLSSGDNLSLEATSLTSTVMRRN